MKGFPLTVRLVLVLAAHGAILARATPAGAMQAVDEAPRADSTMAMPLTDPLVVVSLDSRTLSVVVGADTIRRAPIAVASGMTLEYGGHRWHFETPKGRRVVRAKRANPVWMPPDWHYAEVARAHGLRVKRLSANGRRLRDGRRLAVRDSLVGIEDHGDFQPLPVDEHIVFDSTLFIPPLATRNRQLSGELGRFALDLGDGYLLHGTRDEASIGTASTHGCIRLADDDLAWLYSRIPVGAVVLVR